MVVISLLGILISFGLIFGFNRVKTREKMSRFECGFEPLRREGLNFCLRFFLIAVVFLVFDVELVLVIYYIPLRGVVALSQLKWGVFTFVGVVLSGVLHELNEGRLD